MQDEVFATMQAALRSLWPIDGARLFGYSGGWTSIFEVNHPDKLYRPMNSSVTEFERILNDANKHAPDMVFIFSDGLPMDEYRMWNVWNKTTFPISTHLCLPETWIPQNQGAADVMQKLCRGGGQYTYGDTYEALQSGVAQAMAKTVVPYVATARRLPDVSQQVLTGVEAAKNHAAVNERVVELGDDVSEAKADISELQARQIIADAFHQTVSGIDARTVEAIGVQRARDCTDKAAQQAFKADLSGGLLRLSAGILNAIGVGIDNRMARSEAARQAPQNGAEAPLIEHQGMDMGMLNRVGAIAAARAVKDAALPPPEREAVALPARSNGRAIQTPPAQAALAPPSQQALALSAPRGPSTAVAPRGSVVVRKRIYASE
jgi:hypothetical protein